MRFFKVTLPLMMAFTMACIALASQVIPHHYSNSFVQETAYWSKVIGGITMFIGAYSLLRVHYHRIKRQQKGWGYSGLLYVFFGTMLICGLLNRGYRNKGVVQALTDPAVKALLLKTDAHEFKPVVKALTFANGQPLLDAQGNPLFCVFTAREQEESAIRGVIEQKDDLKEGQKDKPIKGPKGRPLYVRLESGTVSETRPIGLLGPLEARTNLKDLDKEPTNWIYESVQRPAGATQYSLLGFFICSAAYRTFRAKTPEAAVLLVAALIVMFGQVPLASLVWDKIPVLSGWLLDIPNMAVKRAILFGICVGSVGTALRVMFGIERSYMGGE